jgi:hypothetical protein
MKVISVVNIDKVVRADPRAEQVDKAYLCTGNNAVVHLFAVKVGNLLSVLGDVCLGEHE